MSFLIIGEKMSQEIPQGQEWQSDKSHVDPYLAADVKINALLNKA